MRYTLGHITAICGGQLSGANLTVKAIFTDSRNSVADGEALFVAINGRNHDGHSYINELYARGVRAFIVECDVPIEQYSDAGFIRVVDSVAALHSLAADHRSQFNGTIIGITGSNGKTVVKEWIASLVPDDVKMFRSPKSYNSQIGVPLSILMMDGDEDLAIIEAGVSEPGEMERLARIIRPDIGIFTTLGDAHQENFVSFEQKAEEKSKLFAEARVIIYNGSYPVVRDVLKRIYPKTELFDASRGKEAYELFVDESSRENASVAIALCDVLGFSHGETVAKLQALQPVAMRLELKEGINNSIIVNDSYNSDINSLAIALDYLKSVAGGKQQTLILSDILQSGFPEKELYEKVAALISQSRVDRVVGIGERIKLYAAVFGVHSDFYLTTEAYLSSIRRDDIAGRAILIKGNRTSRFERLSHALESKSHTTMLEVDLDAMINNLNIHRAMVPSGTKIMAMVKAAGYGNGTYEIAAMLQHQGVDYLAVAFADEGVELRNRGITLPIVVLNADSDSFGLMIANGLEPEIYNFESLSDFVSAIKRYGERSYPVHIKLDTGMHRLGFEPKDIVKLCGELECHRTLLRVNTIFSHLASVDDPDKDTFTRSQIVLFEEMSGRISENLSYRPLRHIVNSAGIERFPEASFDMVRLGIGLYGVGAQEIGLKPVSTLLTRIVQIKEHTEGDTVGYGREGIITKPTRVAIIPVGYADGLNRHLGSGKWSVVVNGVLSPTIGRISMDTCAVDVTGIDVAVGDVVTIFGSEQQNTVSDMARILDTIPYEIMTGISSRVKRIYIKE